MASHSYAFNPNFSFDIWWFFVLYSYVRSVLSNSVLVRTVLSLHVPTYLW